MKVRFGFVSNSSSSSFVVLGVLSHKLACRVIQKCGIVFDEEGYVDVDRSQNIDAFGSGILKSDELTFIFFDSGKEGLCAFGIDLQKSNILETRTLPQARAYFANLIKEKYGIDVPTDKIEIIGGQSHSEE